MIPERGPQTVFKQILCGAIKNAKNVLNNTTLQTIPTCKNVKFQNCKTCKIAKLQNMQNCKHCKIAKSIECNLWSAT